MNEDDNDSDPEPDVPPVIKMEPDPDGDTACAPEAYTTAEASLDLLIVVDDSPSMASEQRSLSRSIPRLVDRLAQGDRDGDGSTDFPPIGDLQVRVVTTTLATAPDRPWIPEDGCSQVGEALARDEVLRYRSELGRIPDHPRDLRRLDLFSGRVSCQIEASLSGSDFEQPLKAAELALTQDYLSHTFPRPGTPLGILFVTDEDDCSISDDAYFRAELHPEIPMPLRCDAFGDSALHPVEHYSDLFVSMVADPGHLAVSVLAGIPSDLEFSVNTEDGFTAVLADPRMERTATTAGLIPSVCGGSIFEGYNNGYATPARRMTELARQLAPSAQLRSVCRRQYYDVIDDFSAQVATAVERAHCVP